jgi:hypothetical protein
VIIMSLNSELQNTLAALKPYIDSTKAKLELDNAAVSICQILSDRYGLYWLEYLLESIDDRRFFLYSSDRYVQKNRLDALVEQLYKSKEKSHLRTLLAFYHQMFGGGISVNDDPSVKFSNLKKIESLAAIKSNEIIAGYCLTCYAARDGQIATCSQCGSYDVFNINKISFLPEVKTILSNGQYLEIYVKRCLRDAGIELIGYPIDQKGRKAFTNIRYQIDGDIIEVDVHGIASPLTLLLCEAKTSEKIQVNELRRIEGLYNRLIDKINTLSRRNFAVLRLFIISGEFDKNISQSAYKRKGWELIDKSNIANLNEVLRELQASL